MGAYEYVDTANNNNFNKLNLKIYPNPTSDFIYIEGLNVESKYSIYDLSGKQIELNLNINNFEGISFEEFSSGIYILKIENNEGISIHKIIKK